MAKRTVHKTCNLCEAMCGLRIDVEDDRVVRIEPDPDDPLSKGAICPKAIALGEVQDDPDRLRTPVRRTERGFEPISWEEALESCAARLVEIQTRDGNDAVASYLGNPGAHNFGIVTYIAGLTAALGSRNKYAASSLDQNPKHASCLMLFGSFLRIPVPDVDRTDFFLILGANPVVSNGSLMTAPGIRKRLRALRERGGKLVVVDPRRSETAALADHHLFIRPGDDAWLLAALLFCILDEGLVRNSRAAALADGRAALVASLRPFAPEAVAERIGISAQVVRELARDFAAAERAVCYGRVGTCLNPYGTLNSWLIDVLNLLTGNLDEPGGAMFPAPAADLAQLAALRDANGTFDDWTTRVRGAPAFNGESPTAVLAEEIETPGPGQVRGLVTVAGNPCVSAPNAAALTRALASLEFFVAIDFYINETTRFADVILPPTWSLEHDNHEILFHGFAVRNTAKYSPTVIEPDPNQRDDWWILSQLALRISQRKATNPLRRLALAAIRRLDLVPRPRRALDWMLRIGKYGDRFRPWRRGLRLRDLEAAPSGIDLGPLNPALPDILLTANRRIDLAAPRIARELERLAIELRAGSSPDEAAAESGDRGLLLIGRREVRTNNSWLHNTPHLANGRDRCTLQIHPADASRHGLGHGDPVRIRSRVGKVEATVELTADLMEGVVSLPHGWGHRGDGLRLRLASANPGVNCNELTDDAMLEPVVGNAVLNGVPVEIEAIGSPSVAS